jgi:hypothetical protein
MAVPGRSAADPYLALQRQSQQNLRPGPSPSSLGPAALCRIPFVIPGKAGTSTECQAPRVPAYLAHTSTPYVYTCAVQRPRRQPSRAGKCPGLTTAEMTDLVFRPPTCTAFLETTDRNAASDPEAVMLLLPRHTTCCYACYAEGAACAPQRPGRQNPKHLPSPTRGASTVDLPRSEPRPGELRPKGNLLLPPPHGLPTLRAIVRGPVRNTCYFLPTRFALTALPFGYLTSH